ncbi:HlyD family secretion protein [Calothrix sp. NIES-3974]|uniref:HlyD family secretion protein n=1 Tax=Calothrix sp. NIES-3974 TaxID=2005462 RepID=UPI000B614235|nr:HlyD family efflux transporter periplasmic adaptor subunit [Calothrix sp. NIES-3974]BAZ06821.1 secretion protein HlyD [Calothrix sp. NIES-3974]
MQNSDISQPIHTHEPSAPTPPDETSPIQPWLGKSLLINPLFLIGFGLISTSAIAILFWGWRHWQYLQSFEATNNAYVFSNITSIDARISGKVEKIFVHPQQPVKKGTVIAQLNSQPYTAKLRQAQGNLQQATLALQLAQENLRQTQTQKPKTEQLQQIHQIQIPNIKNLRTNIHNTRQEVQKLDEIYLKAELDHQRYRQLNQQGLISLATLVPTQRYYERLRIKRDQSLEKWQQMQAKLRQAQLNYLDAEIAKLPAPSSVPHSPSPRDQREEEIQTQQNLEQIRKFNHQKELVNQSQQIHQQIYNYEFSKLRVKIAQNIITQQQQQLQAAKYQLASTKIIAPMHGKIGFSQIEAGTQVKPGQTLMSLIPEPNSIAAHFRPEQLRNIKPGQPVKINISSFGNQTISGQVQKIPHIDPKITNKHQNRTFVQAPVKISFDYHQLTQNPINLIPGTPATVKVLIRHNLE